MNSNGHRCESYPCYYCNREIYFSSSPPTTFMCLDKIISIQVGSLEKISKEYNKYRSDSLYSSKMIDAEVQTTSSYISDKLAETSIEIPKNNNSSLQSHYQSISTNTDFDIDYNYCVETEKKMNKIKQNQKEEQEQEKDIKNQKMIDNMDEMLFSMEYSDDESDINKNSEVLVEEFDGHIDSLPESVFYDIAEELLLQQSMEF